MWASKRWLYAGLNTDKFFFYSFNKGIWVWIMPAMLYIFVFASLARFWFWVSRIHETGKSRLFRFLFIEFCQWKMWLFSSVVNWSGPFLIVMFWIFEFRRLGMLSRVCWLVKQLCSSKQLHTLKYLVNVVVGTRCDVDQRRDVTRPCVQIGKLGAMFSYIE